MGAVLSRQARLTSELFENTKIQTPNTKEAPNFKSLRQTDADLRFVNSADKATVEP
jgi:hypothetical protein